MKNKIEEYKNAIKDAEIKKAKLEGNLDNITKQLKDKYGIETIEQAKEKLETLEKEADKLKSNIDKKMEKLEADFDWS